MTGRAAAAPTRFAWLSIAAALATITLKAVAFALTGSVGLLSDAMESVVNLVAAVVVLIALRMAARPADEQHHYGHSKAEYLSAGAEGTMILVAAAAIVASATGRLLSARPIDHVGSGLAVSIVAAGINGAVAAVLLRAGRRYRAPTSGAIVCLAVQGERPVLYWFYARSLRLNNNKRRTIADDQLFGAACDLSRATVEPVMGPLGL